MLPRLIAVLFDLCLLKRGPQDLPHHPALTLIALAAAVALEAYSATVLGSTAMLPGSMLLSAIFALAAPWAILRVRRVEARYWQTLFALVATGLMFSLLALPLLVALGPLDPDKLPALNPVIGWGIVVLAVWRLVVAGHIWRNALDIPLPIGVLVALGTFMAELLIQRALFASAATAAATTAAGTS
jgi:hypothetical protein